jgi:hypothetical protein
MGNALLPCTNAAVFVSPRQEGKLFKAFELLRRPVDGALSGRYIQLDDDTAENFPYYVHGNGYREGVRVPIVTALRRRFEYSLVSSARSRTGRDILFFCLIA